MPRKKRSRNSRKNDKVTELVKGKPRKEEEKFYVTFSETQLSAVLLLILADTFLVQGVVKFLELTGDIAAIRPWLIIVLLSLFFLVLCVVSITVGGVISPLKYKRNINLASFLSFIIGVLLFVVSLFFLVFTI